jgi:hypothetical protein
MSTTDKLKELHAAVSRSKLDETKYTRRPIARFSASCLVAEVLVFTASEQAGVEMDWGYVGGIVFVYVAPGDGNREKAVRALRCAMPNSLIEFDETT